MKSTAELECVTSRYVAQVVAQLIFVLIAQVGEKSDGSGELVVAEGFESGDGQRRHAERKLQRETEIRIARLRQVQQAGVENQSAQPRGTERISIAERRVPVIVVRGQSGGGQRGLLHQRVVREVAVFASAQEPLRFRRLRPVKAHRADVVAERNGNSCGNGDGGDAGESGPPRPAAPAHRIARCWPDCRRCWHSHGRTRTR